MKHKFTNVFITQDAPTKRAKSGKSQLIIWDAVVPGFGIKVGATGSTFFCQARTPAKKMKSVSLGRHGPGLKVTAARTEAIRVMESIKKGRDPNPKTSGNAITLRAALERKLKKMNDLSARDYRTRFNYLSDWLDIDMTAITEDMVEDKFNDITATGKLDNANKVIKRLATVWNFNERRFGLPKNPTDFMKKEKKYHVIAKKKLPITQMKRDLWLVWNAIEAYPDAVLRNFTKLLALTGARPKQLRTLKWDDVDFDSKTFNMRSGSKTTEENTIPMTDAARTIFREMHNRRMLHKDARREYVFPARGFRKSPCLTEYKTIVAAIRADLTWHFEMYHWRRWMASRCVSVEGISPAEARHLTTHASRDAHDSYEHVDPDDLRRPLQMYENDLLELISKSQRRSNNAA